MDIRRLPFLILALFTLAAPSWSADYDLKNNALKLGQSLNMDFTVKMDEADLSVAAGDQTVKGTMSMNTRRVQTMKITGVNDGRLSEVETDVKEFVQRQGITINGQPRGTEKNEPLHGKVVISKRVNGKWDSQLQTGEPTEAQKKALLKVTPFEEDAIYEDRKIAVGESWTVPQDRMTKFLGDSVAGSMTGTMQCKLERVEDFEGQPCAIVTTELKLTGKSPEPPNLQITMELKGTIVRSLAAKVDLKVELTGILKMEGPIPNPPGATMTVTGPMTMKYTSTIAK